MNSQMNYYAFRRAGDMTDHSFSDSVAVCKATSFHQAKKIFSQMYSDIEDTEILQITGNLNRYGIMVLTDY